MASSWCCEFRCYAEAGHRKWRRRRVERVDSQVAPSKFDPLIRPADIITITAAGQLEQTSFTGGTEEAAHKRGGAIFHDKKLASRQLWKEAPNSETTNWRKPNEEQRVSLPLLLLLLLSLTRLRPLFLVVRPNARIRQQDRRGAVGDNQITRPDEKSKHRKRDDQPTESSPADAIYFIEFNYHNNAPRSLHFTLTSCYHYCWLRDCCQWLSLDRCDINSSSPCDCWSVIIGLLKSQSSTNSLGQQLRFLVGRCSFTCNERCCHRRRRQNCQKRRQQRRHSISNCNELANLEQSLLWMGGLSGGLGDIITFGGGGARLKLWLNPNAGSHDLGERRKTTISRCLLRSREKRNKLLVCWPNSASKNSLVGSLLEVEASSDLELIAPVWLFRVVALNLPAWSWNDMRLPIISGPREEEESSSKMVPKLNKDKSSCLLLSWPYISQEIRELAVNLQTDTEGRNEKVEEERINEQINQSKGKVAGKDLLFVRAANQIILLVVIQVNNDCYWCHWTESLCEFMDFVSKPRTLICIDHDKQAALMSRLSLLLPAASSEATDEMGQPKEREGKCNMSKNLGPGNLLALFDIDDKPLLNNNNNNNSEFNASKDEKDDDEQQQQQCKSLNNNNRPAHYCYRHHHYYYYDYCQCRCCCCPHCFCYCRREPRVGEKSRRARCADNDNNNDNCATSNGTGDMLHCVTVGQPAAPSGGRRESSNNNKDDGDELITDRENSSSNNHNNKATTIASFQEKGWRRHLSARQTDLLLVLLLGLLLLWLAGRVGVSELGFQASAPRRRQRRWRQVRLPQVRPAQSLLSHFCLLLMILCKLQQLSGSSSVLVAANKTSPSSLGRPSIMSYGDRQPDDGSAEPAMVVAATMLHDEGARLEEGPLQQQNTRLAMEHGEKRGPLWSSSAKGDQQQQQQLARQLSSSFGLANKTSNELVAAQQMQQPPDKIGQHRQSGGQIERIESSSSSSWLSFAGVAAERPKEGAKKTRRQLRRDSKEQSAAIVGQPSIARSRLTPTTTTRARLTGSDSGHEQGTLILTSGTGFKAQGASMMMMMMTTWLDDKNSGSSKEPINVRRLPKDRWDADGGDYYAARARLIDKRAAPWPAAHSFGPSAALEKRVLVAASGQNHHHHHHHHFGLEQQQRDQQQQQLCPSKCQCVWKNGKQFADCSRLKLSSVPAGLDPLLQVLNMSSNPMQSLPSNAFNALNLNNLQRIFLSSCQLQTIDEAAFENLKLVVELDFSWNRLQFVPLAQIGRMSLLRKLSMRGNPLKLLTEATFSTGTTSNLRSSADKAAVNLAPTAPAASDLAGDISGNISRLYESYPTLARSLLLSSRRRLSSTTDSQSTSSSSSSTSTQAGEEDIDDSFIIEQMELELLDSIVRQHEEIRTDDGNDDDDDGNDNDGDNDDDYGGSDGLTNQASPSSSSGNEEGFMSAPAVSSSAAANSNQAARRRSSSQLVRAKIVAGAGLGGHFSQLQELDFGQCQLTYIKWSVFDQLKQLKRLHLDGNHLSQLSGKLVETLPLGLHQLSLEGNPWICDCRLLALKRWLQSTRTPLSAPVKCSSIANRTDQQHRHHHQLSNSISLPFNINNIRGSYDSDVVIGNIGSEVDATKEDDDDNNNNNNDDDETGQLKEEGLAAENYLDRLRVENFVCPPQASSCSAHTAPYNTNSTTRSSNRVGGARPNLTALLAYLEPSLINIGGGGGSTVISTMAAGNKPSETTTTTTTKLVEANEGDRVELICSFLAHPDRSVHIAWMADYFTLESNQAQQIQPSAASAKFPPTVLYDSRFDTLTNSTTTINDIKQQQTGTKRAGRIKIEQSNLVANKPQAALSRSQGEQIRLTTRLSIDSVERADAARYKCLAANRAGQTHLEISLRVNLRPAKLSAQSAETTDSSKGGNSIGGRDQRSWQDQVNKLRAEQSLQVAAVSSSLSQVAANVRRQQQQQQTQQQQQQLQQTQPTTTSSAWLRSSTTFQVTIVIVSCLMAAVVIAFILFCIIIYQIKPTSTTSTMVDYLGSPSPAATLQLPKQTFFTTTGSPQSLNPLVGSTIVGGGSQHFIINGGGLGTNSIYGGTTTQQQMTNCTTTPLLAAQVSDPITGQNPVHFIAHPIFQQQQQQLGQHFAIGGQAINNRAFLATTIHGEQDQNHQQRHQLSHQEQESIRMVNNWNTTQTTAPAATATTTTTTISPGNSYSPNSSSQQSGTIGGYGFWPEASSMQQNHEQTTTAAINNL